MFKLLAAILFLIATPLAAQENENVIFMLQQSPCQPTVDMFNLMIAEFDEIPFAKGSGSVYNQTANDWVIGSMTLFVNTDTWSYSVVINFADGVSCQVMTGREFAPAQFAIDNLRE